VCVSISARATHLCLAATPLSFSGAGTVYSDILSLIVLHLIIARRAEQTRDRTQYRFF